MESLFLSWEKFPNLNRGERVEMLSTIDLQPCLLKVSPLTFFCEEDQFLIMYNSYWI